MSQVHAFLVRWSSLAVIKLFAALPLLAMCLAGATAFAQPPQTPVRSPGSDSPPSADASPSDKQTENIELPTADDLRRVGLVLKQLDEKIVIAGAKLRTSAITRKKQLGVLQARIELLDHDLDELAGRLARLQQRREDFRNHAELLDAAETRTLKQRLDEPIAGLERQLQELATQRGRLQQELTLGQKRHTLSLLQEAIDVESRETLELLNQSQARSDK